MSCWMGKSEGLRAPECWGACLVPLMAAELILVLPPLSVPAPQLSLAQTDVLEQFEMKAAPSPPLYGSNVPFLKISFRKKLCWPQSMAEAFPARLRSSRSSRPRARPPSLRPFGVPGTTAARSGLGNVHGVARSSKKAVSDIPRRLWSCRFMSLMTLKIKGGKLTCQALRAGALPGSCRGRGDSGRISGKPSWIVSGSRCLQPAYPVPECSGTVCA